MSELGELIRVEGGRALATLTRVFGDLQLAEDSLQDAIVIALERWPETGVPVSPAAWLTVTARNKALDRLRREGRRNEKEGAAMRDLSPPADDPDDSPSDSPNARPTTRRSTTTPCD